MRLTYQNILGRRVNAHQPAKRRNASAMRVYGFRNPKLPKRGAVTSAQTIAKLANGCV